MCYVIVTLMTFDKQSNGRRIEVFELPGLVGLNSHSFWLYPKHLTHVTTGGQFQPPSKALTGATENARTENAGLSKMQGKCET